MFCQAVTTYRWTLSWWKSKLHNVGNWWSFNVDTSFLSHLGYNSAKIVGDIDNTLLYGLIYCLAFIICIPDLSDLQRKLINFLHQMVRSSVPILLTFLIQIAKASPFKQVEHKRLGVLHSLMSCFDAVIGLIGTRNLCSMLDIDKNLLSGYFSLTVKLMHK